MTPDLEPGDGADTPHSQTEPGRSSVAALGDTLEASTTDPDRESAAESDSDSENPTSVGRFRVLGKLGQGGMGMVYLGLDERLGRKVAIKLLRSRGTAADQARLLREAQAMAQLSHPHVVEVFDVGAEQGLLYVAMERIDGRSLGTWLRERARRFLSRRWYIMAPWADRTPWRAARGRRRHARRPRRPRRRSTPRTARGGWTCSGWPP